MKELKTELRMWFAEKLLYWSLEISPNNEEGKKIKSFISLYIHDKMKNHD